MNVIKKAHQKEMYVVLAQSFIIVVSTFCLLC